LEVKRAICFLEDPRYRFYWFAFVIKINWAKEGHVKYSNRNERRSVAGTDDIQRTSMQGGCPHVLYALSEGAGLVTLHFRVTPAIVYPAELLEAVKFEITEFVFLKVSKPAAFSSLV
jgi:hypothetical protein